VTGSRSLIGFLSIFWALKAGSSGTPGSHHKSTVFGEDEAFAAHRDRRRIRTADRSCAGSAEWDGSIAGKGRLRILILGDAGSKSGLALSVVLGNWRMQPAAMNRRPDARKDSGRRVLGPATRGRFVLTPVIGMHSARLCLGWSLLAVSGSSPLASESTPGGLPTDVAPRYYALRNQPDLERFTTRGAETVDIEVRKPVREIVLNALGLKITRATLIAPKPLTLKPKPDFRRQTVRLQLPTEVAPGDYRLAVGLYNFTTGARLMLPDGTDHAAISIHVQ